MVMGRRVRVGDLLGAKKTHPKTKKKKKKTQELNASFCMSSQMNSSFAIISVLRRATLFLSSNIQRHLGQVTRYKYC